MSSEPTIDFIFRGFPVSIPDTAEKKSYLVLDPLLLTFFDGEIFRCCQNFLTRLDRYFCKEFLRPLLSGPELGSFFFQQYQELKQEALLN